VYEHPEWFLERDRGNFSRRLIFPRTVKNSLKLICPSRATEASLIRRFPAAEGKTMVVYEGTEPTTVERMPLPDRDLILFVGTVEPRKNLVTAIEAFDLYLRKRQDRAPSTQFIIAGRTGWKAEETIDMVRAVNDAWRQVVGGDVIRLLGYVTDQEKESLLAKASVFLFPSLEEGFGLPVLEAMAHGVPVACSDRGSLREVASSAALLFDPTRPSEIAGAVERLIGDEAEAARLRAAGGYRAAQFTWRATAAATLRAYERVLSRS
jgi:alpha-1,3-rhamnosyl/mannosyltransferase